MAGERAKSRTILQRQLDAREKLWPGVSSRQLWYRKERDGFATIPRLMPLILHVMDGLSVKGFPVGATYLEMWCRLFDEGFVTLNRPEEMAFHAGFGGQRAVRTWKDRVRRLHELGFIDLRAGPLGEFSYALVWNPFHVIKKHYVASRISDINWQSIIIRANEVGATDFDDIDDAGNLIAIAMPAAPKPIAVVNSDALNELLANASKAADLADEI